MPRRDYVSLEVGSHWPDPLQLQESLLRLIQCSRNEVPCMFLNYLFLDQPTHLSTDPPQLYMAIPPPEAPCPRTQCEH